MVVFFFVTIGQPALSVAIATYEMAGMGREYLRQTLMSIHQQDMTDVEVVVSDDSRDKQIMLECRLWDQKIAIKYFQNTGPRVSASRKLNQAISQCSGAVIKILCQDDVLQGKDSLRRTFEAFESGAVWLVSAYSHIDEDGRRIGSHIPKLHPRIERVNSIGSHSSLAFIRKRQSELFDEQLFWRMDCELYRRLLDKYGAPMILNHETVCVRQWTGQSTNSIVKRADRIREWLYVAKKYPRKSKVVH